VSQVRILPGALASDPRKWFSLIERQAIHRATFASVKDLNAKIRAFIDGWNDRRHHFVWTKTADQILTKANRRVRILVNLRGPR
jgi:hypothetical protein